MIMHVAEAGEQRGRVVLQLTSGHPSPIALEAALRIAQAFRSELESVFVEDQQLLDMASFSFAREVSFSGRRTRSLSADAMAREVRLAALAVSRHVEELARLAEVPFRRRIVQDEPVQALAAACAEHGPWNVVAIADPIGGGNCEALRAVFLQVTGNTGLVLVGPRARRSAGPVVAVVEDLGHLEAMLHSGMRLRRHEDEEVTVLLVADDEDRGLWMESQARLALADTPAVRLVAGFGARGSSDVVAEVLRRLSAGFAIAQYGGLLIPEEGSLRHLAAALECPLFLMR